MVGGDSWSPFGWMWNFLVAVPTRCILPPPIDGSNYDLMLKSIWIVAMIAHKYFGRHDFSDRISEGAKAHKYVTACTEPAQPKCCYTYASKIGAKKKIANSSKVVSVPRDLEVKLIQNHVLHILLTHVDSTASTQTWPSSRYV